MTETGYEAANLGMQVYGGHGYIREWGLEQNVRDARIAMLYEGTTGIQALDLLGRKVMLSGGDMLRVMTREIHAFCEEQAGNAAMASFVTPLQQVTREWESVTEQLGAKAVDNPDEINAACVDYLMYSGYVVYAYLFARAALTAQQALEGDTTESAFYQAKIYLARFYFQRLLPRTDTLAKTMASGLASLYDETVDPFVDAF